MIYKNFEEWADGQWLEDGEPRKQAYTRDELLLIEMGWNYGVDAARLAQPEPEPWAGVDFDVKTTPPQREWQGLTDEEYEAMAEKRVTNFFFNTLDYAHAIEAKLKEKNYG